MIQSRNYSTCRNRVHMPNAAAVSLHRVHISHALCVASLISIMSSRTSTLADKLLNEHAGGKTYG